MSSGLINPCSEANFVIAFFATVGMCGRFIGEDFIQEYFGSFMIK